jgi:hypothetical protein
VDGLEAALRGLEGMRLKWSPVWRAEWANSPDEYVTSGAVQWERTRRLLRGDDERLGLRMYLGVRHSDPTRWGVVGEPRALFFASVLRHGRTLLLHTYPTAAEALAALAGARNLLAGDR